MKRMGLATDVKARVRQMKSPKIVCFFLEIGSEIVYFFPNLVRIDLDELCKWDKKEKRDMLKST